MGLRILEESMPFSLVDIIATMVCSVRRLYFGYFEDLHCYGSVLGLGGDKSCVYTKSFLESVKEDEE
jgi:hypothetical protein